MSDTTFDTPCPECESTDPHPVTWYPPISQHVATCTACTAEFGVPKEAVVGS